MCYNTLRSAGVAELADASDLGSDALRCAGSIPVTRTKTSKLSASIVHRDVNDGGAFCVAILVDRGYNI